MRQINITINSRFPLRLVLIAILSILPAISAQTNKVSVSDLSLDNDCQDCSQILATLDELIYQEEAYEEAAELLSDIQWELSPDPYEITAENSINPQLFAQTVKYWEYIYGKQKLNLQNLDDLVDANDSELLHELYSKLIELQWLSFVLKQEDESISYSNRILEMIEEHPIEFNEEHKIYALMNLGKNYFERYLRSDLTPSGPNPDPDLPRSTEYFASALELITAENQDRFAESEEIALLQMLTFYGFLPGSNDDQELAYYKRLLSILADQEEPGEVLKSVLVNLIETEMDEAEAADYALQLLALYEDSNYIDGFLTSATDSIAESINYMDVGSQPYMHAVDYLNQVLTLIERTSGSIARLLITQQDQITDANLGLVSEIEEAVIYAALGKAYLWLQDNDKAEEFYFKSINLLIATNDEVFLNDSSIGLSSFSLDDSLYYFSSYLREKERIRDYGLVSDVISRIRNSPAFLEDGHYGLQVKVAAVHESLRRATEADFNDNAEGIRQHAEHGLNIANTNPDDFFQNLGGTAVDEYDADWQGERSVIEFISPNTLALLNIQMAQYYGAYMDNNEKYLEHVDVAIRYDSYWDYWKVAPYAWQENWDTVYESLMELDTSNLEELFDFGCEKPSSIANHWNDLRNAKIPSNIDLLSEQQLTEFWESTDGKIVDYAYTQLTRIWQEMFKDLDDERYLCGRSNFEDLSTYAMLIEDEVKQAELSYAAWVSYTDHLLAMSDSDEFIYQAESYADSIPSYYLQNCSVISDSDKNIFEFYQERCEENSLLALDLASLDHSTARILAGTWKASVETQEEQQVIREVSYLKEALSNVDLKLASMISNGEEGSAMESVRLEKLRLSTQLDSLLNELTDKDVLAEAMLSPYLISESDYRNLLMDHEAILFLKDFSGGDYDRTELHLITKETTKRIRVDTQSIKDASERLRTSLNVRGISNVNNLPDFDTQLAYEIFSNTLGQFLDEDLQGIENFIVITTGVLENLPLSILITEDPAESDFNIDRAWAHERFTFSRLPSIRSLYTLRTTEKSISMGGKFLGIGDPSLGPYQDGTRSIQVLGYEQGDVDKDILKSLPSLPGTALELETLATYYEPYPSSNLLLGSEATEFNLNSLDLGAYSTIAFATHGLLSGSIPGLIEPALVLTPGDGKTTGDGLLTATEISEMDLNAELVILSACDTNLDEQMDAKGLPGLATAFLYAGVQSLMVTHWPVDTRVSSFITTTTINRYRNDPTAGIANALMFAISETRKKPGWDHPSIWGPFSIIGDNS
jgi:CHAT domain-containing protein